MINKSKPSLILAKIKKDHTTLLKKQYNLSVIGKTPFDNSQFKYFLKFKNK